MNGGITGYYSYSEVSSIKVKLDNIFISPTYIGQRLGKKLMTDFINRIEQTSYKEITLDAEPNAESFYKKFGFKTVGQLESSIVGRTLPIMVLSLDEIAD